MKHGDPVYLLLGDDDYLKENAVNGIISSIFEGRSLELDYMVFHGQDANSGDILGYVMTAPFSAPKRLAVIKEFEKVSTDSRSRILSYIKNPSKTACLVLEAKSDSILRELGDAAGYITLKKIGSIQGDELTEWISRFLSLRKKTIDQEASALLIEFKGNDLSGLSRELEKLASYIGKRESVKVEDVEMLVGKSLIANAFDLTAAIEKKDVRRAMGVASELLAAGKKHYEIVGLLCWLLKRMLKAKAMKGRGKSEAYIMEALKINRRSAGNFFRQLNMVTDSQVRSRIDILLEADLDIKRTRFDPTLVLEFAIIRLCLSGA